MKEERRGEMDRGVLERSEAAGVKERNRKWNEGELGKEINKHDGMTEG